MSNMQMREKLRKITQAASDSKQIPEQTKRVGMMIFFLLIGLGLLAALIFSVVLIVYGHYLSALITLVATALIGYIGYRIQSADEIPID